MLFKDDRSQANFEGGNANGFNVNSDGNAPNNNNVNNSDNGVRPVNFLITPIKRYITLAKVLFDIKRIYSN